MQLVTLKCPECGAKLEIEEGRTKCFCSYCGSKILLDDEHHYTYRKIDEARIKEAESNQAVRTRQIEKDERNEDNAHNLKIVKLKILVGLVLLGIALIIIQVILDRIFGASGAFGPDSLTFYGFLILLGSLVYGLIVLTSD